MPLDLLIERLKMYDELMLLELLDINSDDLLERFRDKVLAKKDYLESEVEEFVGDDEEDPFDGFSIEDYNERDE